MVSVSLELLQFFDSDEFLNLSNFETRPRASFSFSVETRHSPNTSEKASM